MAIVVLALALVVVVDRVLADGSSGPATNFADRLFEQPREDGVYLLGNSMFKTGIDPALIADGLPTETPVDFEYHNGHYTNLWYLIAKSALGKTEADPRVVVWGFRPHFAADPAFRVNTLNDTDLFVFDDPLYAGLSAGVDFTTPPAFSSANVKLELAERSGLYGRRSAAGERVSSESLVAGVEVLDWAGISFADRLRDSVLSGERSLADEITRLVTDGEVVLTEELVIDDEGDFIRGPRRAFDAGYAPATALAIADANLRQLVILWRPRIAAEGSPNPIDDLFIAEAIAWFDDHEIPYVDLYSDDRITIDYFASGDHYNEDGRREISEIVGQALLHEFYAND